MIKQIIGHMLVAAVLASGISAFADTGAPELPNEPGGQERNIIEIGSVEEFALINEMLYADQLQGTDDVGNTRFVLTADINFEGKEIYPIGLSDKDESLPLLFGGELDGNGHKISDFKISRNNANCVYTGLFAGIAEGASVRDVRFENSEITVSYDADWQPLPEATAEPEETAVPDTGAENGADGQESDPEEKTYIDLFAGIIAGISSESKIENCSIDNCRITVNVDNDDISYVYAGCVTGMSGAISEINNVQINKSGINTDLMSAAPGYVGGAAGIVYGQINNVNIAQSGVRVTALSDNAVVGGIAGFLVQGTMSKCNADSCDIYAKSKGVAKAGGIAGRNSDTIRDCKSNSDVSSVAAGYSNGWAGGIVGALGDPGGKSSPLKYDYSGYIENCIYDGRNSVISIDSEQAADSDVRPCYCGGIVGQMYSKTAVRRCSAILSDTSFATNTEFKKPTQGIYYGGIAGCAIGGDITQCSTQGVLRVASAFTAGGIAGSARCNEYYQNLDAEGANVEKIRDSAHISYCDSEVDIDVSTTNNVYTGGIVGYMHGSYEDCKNGPPLLESCRSVGDVSVALNKQSLVAIIGGAVGYSVDSRVKNCYSVGDVALTGITGTNFLGGCIGRIKENNAVSTISLSVTENCFSKGKVSYPDGSGKVPLAGMFTSELSGNNAPDNFVAPIVKNCCFYSNDTMKPQTAASQLTDATVLDKTSYPDWDFQNIWYMDKDGVHLMIEKPCVYTYEAERQNGTVTRITKLKLSRPEEIKAVNIDFTDLVFGVDLPEYKQTIYIDNVSEFEKQFKDIDVDIEVPVATDFVISVDAEEKQTFSIGAPQVNNGVLEIKVNNTDKRPMPVRLIAAEYADDGSLKAVSLSELSEVVGEQTLMVGLPGAKNNVMLWNTVGGALPLLAQFRVDLP